jgi:hypothetical protein
MRRLAEQFRIPGAVLAMAVLLTSSSMGQNKNQGTQVATPGVARTAQQLQPGDIPSCNGASSASSVAHGPSQVNPKPHSVTLSWNAAASSSNSPRDAIKGYYVYRSLTSHKYTESNRISDAPVQGTKCVDTNVEPRKTYFYVVKAVTDGGKQSGASLEIKAVVPFP